MPQVHDLTYRLSDMPFGLLFNVSVLLCLCGIILFLLIAGVRLLTAPKLWKKAVGLLLRTVTHHAAQLEAGVPDLHETESCGLPRRPAAHDRAGFAYPVHLQGFQGRKRPGPGSRTHL